MNNQRIRRAGRGVAAFLAAAFAFGVISCQTNPATGERQLNLISTDQEIAMGRQANDQIRQTMGLYPDEGLQRYVSEIGTTVAATSERPELPWTFSVVDDDTVNAFALPGGFVYVTRGILAHFNSEAQLVGVLGHEIGHVTAQHASTRLSKIQLTQLGVGLAMVVEPGLQQLAPLAGVGMQLLFLSFSREDEREADKLGVRYMSNVGEDPHSLIDVMETLKRVSEAQGGGRMPQWLATHPNPENRQENIREYIKEDVKRTDFKPVEREAYLRRIDGIVFGADPREGYTRDSTFYHPAMRFTMNFPQEWSVINQKQAVIALSPEQDATVQLTVANQPSVDAAAQDLASMEQVQVGNMERTRINGLPARIGTFVASTQQGPIDGLAAFLEYDGRVFQLIGYAPREIWPKHRENVNAAIRSFDELTDRSAIDVEPLRIDITRADRSTTLQELYDRYYRGRTAPVPLEQIALINQMQPDTRIDAGTSVKMVTGTLP